MLPPRFDRPSGRIHLTDQGNSPRNNRWQSDARCEGTSGRSPERPLLLCAGKSRRGGAGQQVQQCRL